MSQFRSRTSPWLSGGSRPRPHGHDGHPTGAATGGAGGGGGRGGSFGGRGGGRGGGGGGQKRNRDDSAGK